MPSMSLDAPDLRPLLPFFASGFALREILMGQNFRNQDFHFKIRFRLFRIDFDHKKFNQKFLFLPIFDLCLIFSKHPDQVRILILNSGPNPDHFNRNRPDSGPKSIFLVEKSIFLIF